jgi:SAM-dependent methyltransferase
MNLDLHYVDPRLVALYDLENPRGSDTDFYVALAADIDARTIVDLGCGTGLLAGELATDGRVVYGVDPAPAMLAVARARPGAENVQWIEADASNVPPLNADLVVMTGNVAQVFLTDEDWAAALRAIQCALRPGGYLAFESRNPEVQGWKAWNRDATFSRFDSPNGPVESWLELVGVADRRVRFEGHNVFLATGEHVVVCSELRFRTPTELAGSLAESGFTIERTHGDWHRGPLKEDSRVIVTVAQRG